MSAAIARLEVLLQQLPTDHSDRPGVIRAIEVLRHEGEA